MLSVRCFVTNGVTKIRVQTNSLPDHCFYALANHNFGQLTDFEVAYSPTVTSQNQDDITTQLVLDQLQCLTRPIAYKFPSGAVNPRYLYIT